jgi:hypothetical protein
METTATEDITNYLIKNYSIRGKRTIFITRGTKFICQEDSS